LKSVTVLKQLAVAVLSLMTKLKKMPLVLFAGYRAALEESKVECLQARFFESELE
jgi:hypothetical protein